jgi:hypothetical protein
MTALRMTVQADKVHFFKHESAPYRRNVAYWPLADIPRLRSRSAHEGKADIKPVCVPIAVKHAEAAPTFRNLSLCESEAAARATRC